MSNNFIIYLLWWDWDLSSGLYAYKAGALARLQSHFGLVILKMGSCKLFAQAGL
jgi:hypothetical protein